MNNPNKNFATLAAPLAIPPKPKTAATIAMTNAIKAYSNISIFLSFFCLFDNQCSYLYATGFNG